MAERYDKIVSKDQILWSWQWTGIINKILNTGQRKRDDINISNKGCVKRDLRCKGINYMLLLYVSNYKELNFFLYSKSKALVFSLKAHRSKKL